MIAHELSPASIRQVVPPWLVNLADLAWRILVVAAMLAVLAYLAGVMYVVTAALVIAVIVSATFAPLVMRLRGRGWSRLKAASVVTLVGLVAFIVVTALIVLAFIPSIVNLGTSVSDGVTRVKGVLADLNVPPNVLGTIQDAVDTVKAAIAASLGSVVGTISTAVTITILAGFEIFFFLLDGDKGWDWLARQTSPDARNRLGTAGEDALTRVGGYLRGTAVISGGTAIVEFVAMYLLGVPLAAPLAVLVFLGGFIPYFGGLVSGLAILLVAWATVGPHVAFIMLVIIGIVNVVRGKIVAPILYSKTVSIHPALVLVAVPAGAVVAEIVGMFAAIPVVAMVLAVTGAVVGVIDAEGDGDHPAIVPVWLDRLGQWSWRLLVAILVAALLIRVVTIVPVIVGPMILGILVAATFLPLMGSLVRRGWGRTRAAIAVIGGVTLGVVLISALSIAALVGYGSQMAGSGNSGAGSINDATGGRAQWFVDTIQSATGQLLSVIGALSSELAALAVTIVLGLLLAFYFLRDGPIAGRRIRGRFASARGRGIDELGTRSIGILSGYMIATGVISAVGAASQVVIMVVLGIPLALPLGVLAFILGFIPYIGSFISTGLAFLVTVAVGTPEQVAIMLIWTLVFNIVVGSFVGPLVYAKAVNLHPAIVMAAIPAGSALAGVMGMFLAVPVVAIVSSTWRIALHVFDTEVPGPAAPAHDTSPPPGSSPIQVIAEAGSAGIPEASSDP